MSDARDDFSGRSEAGKDNWGTASRGGRRAIWIEIAIVLGLSLGASAVYSIVAIIARVTAEAALGDQSASLNPSQSPRAWLDFTYQFLGIAFDLFPVALVLYLLWRSGGNPFRRIGFDLTRPGRDTL